SSSSCGPAWSPWSAPSRRGGAPGPHEASRADRDRAAAAPGHAGAGTKAGRTAARERREPPPREARRRVNQMAKIYYDADADIDDLQGQTIAVIGYGSQGHAHALNARDSGCDVVVGLRRGSNSWAAAEAAGLRVMEVAAAAAAGDIVMVLLPDEVQGRVYREQIEPHLEPGNALAFAQGFNIHFHQIAPPKAVDCFMVAPKGPGHLVRRTYREGAGVPCLVAVHQDATGKAQRRALAYAKAI